MNTPTATTVSRKTVIKRRKALLEFFRTTKVQRCTSTLQRGKKVCAVGGAALIANIPMYNEPDHPKFVGEQVDYQAQRAAYQEWEHLNEVTYERVRDYYGFTEDETIPDGNRTWDEYMVELNDSDNLTFKKIADKLEKMGFLNVGA